MGSIVLVICSHPAPLNLSPPFALTQGVALLPASQIIPILRSSENDLRDDPGMGVSPILNPDLHYGSGGEGLRRQAAFISCAAE